MEQGEQIIMGRGSLIAQLTFVALISSSMSQAKGNQSNHPTVDEAQAFVTEAQQQLLDLWIKAGRASWVQSNFITVDTEKIAAQAQEELIAATMDLAKASTRFDSLQLPEEVQRKIRLLRTSLPLAAPDDPEKRAALAAATTAMESMYGKGQYCPDGDQARCLDLIQMSRIMAESRNTRELLDIWIGWRRISPPMKDKYALFVDLANEGARELGFSDLGEMWRSGYDMPPEDFRREVERLWEQVRPLYESLHCYVRNRLGEMYGKEIVAEGKPIPAHLLGNMWAQSWSNVYDMVAPPERAGGFDLTELLRARNTDAREMVRYGERFFMSLGFEPLPEQFWERSLFTQPQDRDVVCHASAWNIDFEEDLRIKMCIEITAEDFQTVHHELGHNFYQRAYKDLPPLYRNSANDGFHEGIGDTIALSVTPEYLAQIGLLEEVPDEEGDLALLMRMALDKVAFLPFGLLVDQWRWKVFAGEVGPDSYNQLWWQLREQYQGVTAPLARSEEDFDPGAKYHIPGNTPYTRYFLAHILQFQFHRAFARQAGWEGPIHRFSIYGNREIGARLKQMLEMGQSRPWPEALEVLTGEKTMDAGALLDYFAPLQKWLDEQNRGRRCGWR
jgi:peptidyl-dipeptidase A